MRLEAREIDAAAFAPFGLVIDAAARAPELINDGTTPWCACRTASTC